MDKSSLVPTGTRFACQFSGCTRSFTRKEHLVRHAQSHSESARHVCKVCLREFTRSDSLQRHITRHGESFKPSPSGRSKRACVACHASKTKCDGNEICSRCTKKGVECVYEQQDPHPQTGFLSDAQGHGQDERHSNHPSLPEQIENFNGQTYRPPPADQNISSRRIIPRVSLPPAVGSSNDQGQDRIEWILASRIERDTPPPKSQPVSRIIDENPYPFPEALVKKYTELYLTYFHHRWPIIHSPTFDHDGPNIMISSMLMIGAWLSGTSESTECAISMSSTLTAQIFQRLTHVSSGDIFQECLPSVLCQAALLNVIFGLYCGREYMISRSIIMRNTLVAVLREVGVFKPEIPYDKPNTFPPFRLAKLGERHRLVAYLFKIDSYFSLLRCQPALVGPEELSFSLPSTFSLSNADGLHIWETRYSIEPTARAQKITRDVIQDPDLDTSSPTDGLMLIEDIQLGLCAMQSSIWQWTERLHQNTDINNFIQRDFLTRRLESWKRLLDRIPLRQCDHINLSQDQHMTMRFYYGLEEHSEAGWQMKVLARPQGLIFDVLMLYHLLSLNLYADIRVLCQLTQDSSSDLETLFGSPYGQEKLGRETAMREWTQTAYARRALCHSADVLVGYTKLSGPENKTIDPIAFVALSASALVIWAFCTFGENGCEVCVQTMMSGLCSEVELTKWSENQDEKTLQQEKETWVEMGGGRISLTGTQFCRCNKELLIAKFKACLPEGWQIARYSCTGI